MIFYDIMTIYTDLYCEFLDLIMKNYKMKSGDFMTYWS